MYRAVFRAQAVCSEMLVFYWFYKHILLALSAHSALWQMLEMLVFYWFYKHIYVHFAGVRAARNA